MKKVIIEQDLKKETRELIGTAIFITVLSVFILVPTFSIASHMTPYLYIPNSIAAGIMLIVVLFTIPFFVILSYFTGKDIFKQALPCLPPCIVAGTSMFTYTMLAVALSFVQDPKTIDMILIYTVLPLSVFGIVITFSKGTHYSINRIGLARDKVFAYLGLQLFIMLAPNIILFV